MIRTLSILLIFFSTVNAFSAPIVLRSGESTLVLGTKVFCDRVDDSRGYRIVLPPNVRIDVAPKNNI